MEETPKEMQEWKEGMKNKVVAEIITKRGVLKIFSKTVNLLIGDTLAGKTASCLNLAADAIRKGNKVMFVDTEKTSVIDRPEPNLLKRLYSENKGDFDKLFFHTKEFDVEHFFQKIETLKPTLLIIDSIYEPFNQAYYKRPRERAVAIREFVYKLRELISPLGIGAVLTTQITTATKDNKEEPLGGRGLLYTSDVKAFFNFVGGKDNNDDSSGKRMITIDRQISFPILFDYGGKILKGVEDEKVNLEVKSV